MPIGKISKSGGGFRGLSSYVLAEGKEAEKLEKKPEILEKNNIYSNNARDISREFREVANLNKRITKPVGHFSVSFDPKENISREKQLEFTKNVVKEMGLDEKKHQYVIISHSDKKHFHHHVAFNRVDLEGKVLNDSFTKNKLEVAIDKQEKKMNLDNSLAETRRFVYDESADKQYRTRGRKFLENKKVSDTKKGVATKKEFISDKIRESLEDKKVTNISELQKELSKHNISVNYTANSYGLSGVSFKKDNYSVKGTAVNFKAGQIQRHLDKNKLDMEKKQKEQTITQEQNQPKYQSLSSERIEAIRKSQEEKQKQEVKQEQTKNRGMRM